MEKPALESISAHELGEIRRELLHILREIEPQRDPTGQVNVCRRIQRLCCDGRIPDSIGDLMHVVRKCRNRAEYEEHCPEGKEARAILSAWAAIKDWSLNRTRCAV